MLRVRYHSVQFLSYADVCVVSNSDGESKEPIFFSFGCEWYVIMVVNFSRIGGCIVHKSFHEFELRHIKDPIILVSIAD